MSYTNKRMRCEQGQALVTQKQDAANLTQLKQVRSYLLKQMLMWKLQANKAEVPEASREIKMPGYEVMYNNTSDISE